MADYGIKPTRGATGVLISGQTITVGSSSATSFASFNALTQIVAVQFRGGDVYCTFDSRTAPSASSGFQLYNAKAYHWDVNTATAAKMIGVSGSVTSTAQEFQVYPGDTQLPDTSVVKSLAAP